MEAKNFTVIANKNPAAKAVIKLHYTKILNNNVAAVQIPDVIAIISHWIEFKNESKYCVLLGMHGLMEARQNSVVQVALSNADLLLPDGMPLVWISRLKGQTQMKRRVYGPELMMEFCAKTNEKFKHYFYGGHPGVAEDLALQLQLKHRIQTVGTMSPPFHDLTDIELQDVANAINRSEADMVWIGLSTPKQEILMNRLRPLVRSKILLGVGAAFDFNSGRKRMAPKLMQENGLEWAFRLYEEPRRLWRRYLILGPRFVFETFSDLASYYYRQWTSKSDLGEP